MEFFYPVTFVKDEDLNKNSPSASFFLASSNYANIIPNGIIGLMQTRCRKNIIDYLPMYEIYLGRVTVTFIYFTNTFYLHLTIYIYYINSLFQSVVGTTWLAIHLGRLTLTSTYCTDTFYLSLTDYVYYINNHMFITFFAGSSRNFKIYFFFWEGSFTPHPTPIGAPPPGLGRCRIDT